ncbi:transposable element Tcb2 transposase [Trichonephila clavipes]|nr:transposable element Tcb2 transposase [Trichonephila clavipes]
MIVRSVTNKPMTSAQNIAKELLSSCNVSVSAQTVRNVLHSAGLIARTPRNKPYVSEVNRKRRLKFATKYKNKPMDFWKKVIFSDESKFEIFTPPGIRKIWRKNKTTLEPKNVLLTLKYGGGNVMVWGCVVMGGRLSIRITTVICISALLLFTSRGISGSASHPTEKGDAFPTPGRRQCTHKYIMIWDVFWEFPAFWGSHGPREDIPPLTSDQSEKLIVFRKRILSRIHR